MIKSTNPSKKEKKAKNNGNSRFDLARLVLWFGLLALSVLGVAAIVSSAIAGPEDKLFESIKDILTLLLPVIGAWVGTVLAYYFSKENFETAARSTAALYESFTTTEEKLRSILAKEVMIPIEDAGKLILEKKENEYKLKADIIDGILEKDKKNIRNRLPVLDPELRPKYMIHRSLIDEFIVRMVDQGKKLVDLTLQDMLDNSDFEKKLKESFRTVEESTNLAEVKVIIDQVQFCSDVFVTESGKLDSKVLGWITNVIITTESNI